MIRIPREHAKPATLLAWLMLVSGLFVSNPLGAGIRINEVMASNGTTIFDDGVWEGWLVTEPTGNRRFTPGNAVRMLLILNDGSGGEEPVWFLPADSTVTVTESSGVAFDYRFAPFFLDQVATRRPPPNPSGVFSGCGSRRSQTTTI